MPPQGRVGRVSWRAATSVLLTASFLMLVVSGVVLFLAPPGRVANWGGWTALGLTKRDWVDLHLCSSALFVLASGVHVVLNFRCLVGYFRRWPSRWIAFRWDWAAALALAAFVFAGTRAGLWPFSAFLSWRETLRRGADAQETTVSDAAAARLRTRQPAAEGPAPGRQDEQRVGRHDTRTGGRAGAAPGWGRMTLRQYCEAQQMDLRQAQARLAAKGIRFAPDRTLREIAADNGYESPREIVALLGQRNN